MNNYLLTQIQSSFKMIQILHCIILNFLLRKTLIKSQCRQLMRHQGTKVPNIFDSQIRKVCALT